MDTEINFKEKYDAINICHILGCSCGCSCYNTSFLIIDRINQEIIEFTEYVYYANINKDYTYSYKFVRPQKIKITLKALYKYFCDEYDEYDEYITYDDIYKNYSQILNKEIYEISKYTSYKHPYYCIYEQINIEYLQKCLYNLIDCDKNQIIDILISFIENLIENLENEKFLIKDSILLSSNKNILFYI